MKKILFSFLLLSSLCFAKVPQRAVSAAHFSTETNGWNCLSR